MTFLAFIGLAAIAYFLLRTLAGYRKGKRKKAEMIDMALRDYMRVKQAMKAWKRSPEDAALREAADEASGYFRQIQQSATFTRASDVKSAEEAMQFVYIQQFAHLEAIDRDIVYGDHEFLEALIEIARPQEAL